jgi:hypothetical protein
MHFNIYDAFYSHCSQQHVSAVISAIYRVILLYILIIIIIIIYHYYL